ncbi:MAG: hypothetical protein NVV74_02395 [Magnetospirillum sp.]|nr:hypothetical protein [Magnetospirillum sp.]
MKTPFLAVVLIFTAPLCSAQETFPGLKSVLSAAEWERSGLNKLTPDELGVIDAALIRYNLRTADQMRRTIAASQPAQSVASVSSPNADNAPKGWFEKFGLPVFNNSNWRDLPALKAKVVRWEGGNRFVLDNGQVWEGFERITYDLPGKNIEIQARPAGQFALVVEGTNTTIRVMRLR